MPSWPRLEMKHLTMLVALAEGRSVAQAADELALTPSAVTHRIREAERRLGVTLFDRVGKRLVLTPAGDRLVDAARRAVAEIARAEEDLIDRGEAPRQIVRLAQELYSRWHWLPALLRRLEAAAPELEVDLVARATFAPLEALEEGAIDVAIVQGPGPRTPAFDWTGLGWDPLVVIMAPDHRLAERAYIEAADLAEERYFTYSLAVAPGHEWEAVFRPAGISPRRISRVEMPEAIIDMVRAGFGVSVLSRWAVEPELRDGTLIARPLTPSGLWLRSWLVTRAGLPPDAPARRFTALSAQWSQESDDGRGTVAFRGA